MGSSSSHLVSSSRPSTKRPGPGGSMLNRTRLKISSLFCGSSSNSKSTFELEEYADRSPATSTNVLAQSSIVESSSVFDSEMGDTSSSNENGNSTESNSSFLEESFIQTALVNGQTSRDQIDNLNSKEPLLVEPSPERSSGRSPNSISEATAEGTALVSSGYDQSTSPAQGHIHPLTEELEYNSDLRSLSLASDLLRLPGDDDHAHVTTAASSGYLVSDSAQDLLRSRDLLPLDVVSLSSNFLSSSTAEINSRESRRNSRRLFWDALSRSSFRRHSDSPTFVFATGLADDLGSHDRWLVDFDGNLHYNGAGHDFESLSARHRRNEGRWLLRSELSERLLGDHQNAFCASGLHPEGSCSCDSFFTDEEFNTLASISRIIMLAEALFEVLDEIHHQSLSLSLSNLSIPAPESVVDAFPLRFHKKVKHVDSDPSSLQQCHICLADYEEGDKLRVLPCNHEYHVRCIDKWLKEVNRVCPVCRHNVCENSAECSISNV